MTPIENSSKYLSCEVSVNTMFFAVSSSFAFIADLKALNLKIKTSNSLTKKNIAPKNNN